ncbi:hypothetical protein DSI38_08760, partial [Mycobacterium tuberculosis]
QGQVRGQPGKVCKAQRTADGPARTRARGFRAARRARHGLHLPHAPGDPAGPPGQLSQVRHDAGARDADPRRGRRSRA